MKLLRIASFVMAAAQLGCGHRGRLSARPADPDVAAITREAFERVLFLPQADGKIERFTTIPGLDIAASVDSIAFALGVRVKPSMLDAAKPRYPYKPVLWDTLVVCADRPRRLGCVIHRDSLTIAGIQNVRLDVGEKEATLSVAIAVAYARKPGPEMAPRSQEVIFRRGPDGVWRFDRLGHAAYS
jgi:hypothetical protein